MSELVKRIFSVNNNYIRLIDTGNIFLPKNYTLAPDDIYFIKLKESIRENGLLVPIVVRCIRTRDYEVLSGCRRLICLKDIGEQRIPCIIKENIDDTMAKEFRLLEMVSNKEQKDLDLDVTIDNYNNVTRSKQEVINFMLEKTKYFMTMITELGNNLLHTYESNNYNKENILKVIEFFNQFETALKSKSELYKVLEEPITGMREVLQELLVYNENNIEKTDRLNDILIDTMNILTTISVKCNKEANKM